MGLAIPGIGPIVAAGPLAATLAGAGVGAVAGGLIGGLTRAGVPEDEANVYAEAVRRGGALVTVRAEDSRAEVAADHAQERCSRHRASSGAVAWAGLAALRSECSHRSASSDLQRERPMYDARPPKSSAGLGIAAAGGDEWREQSD